MTFDLYQGHMIKKFFFGGGGGGGGGVDPPVIVAQQNLLTTEACYFTHMFILSKTRADYILGVIQ